MKNSKVMSISILVFSVFTLLSCSENNLSQTEKMQEALENLSGTYMDVEPYGYGEAFGQRIFTFDQGKWSLKFTLGLDPKLEHQVFEFRTYGTYEIIEPSAIVEDAFNAVFGEDKKFLTLKTDNPQLIEAFGFASCDLTPYVEKDISIAGCSLWKPVSVCPADYDLLSLDEDGLLHFGVRPADNDMCTADKRPISLTPGVTKI